MMTLMWIRGIILCVVKERTKVHESLYQGDRGCIDQTNFRLWAKLDGDTPLTTYWNITKLDFVTPHQTPSDPENTYRKERRGTDIKCHANKTTYYEVNKIQFFFWKLGTAAPGFVCTTGCSR